MPNNIITTYLKKLRSALAGYDPAMIQDALSDAEEHLRTALEQLQKNEPEISKAAAMEKAVKKYGTPEEIASAYLELEERIQPVMARPVKKKKGSAASRFFSVMVDPRSYAAFFYLLFSLITGIFYFTWAITGISLSLGLLVMIIGIPVFGFFLLSFRGMALVEGRLVEALLGVRMPRRPVFSRRDISVWERFKFLLTDPLTWKTCLYMILMLPLGILYFNVTIITLSLALWGIIRPVLEYGFDFPYMVINNTSYFTPGWYMPIAVVSGFLWLVVSMHIIRGLGRLHGRIARAILIRD